MKKEMVYSPKRIREELCEGNIDGFEYIIVSYGIHPCAYVSIPKDHKFFKVDSDEMEIYTHGGLTYSNDSPATGISKDDEWWIGWDYAHFSDYSGYEISYDIELHIGGKKWTTDEILKHVEEVIRQLKEVE